MTELSCNSYDTTYDKVSQTPSTRLSVSILKDNDGRSFETKTACYSFARSLIFETESGNRHHDNRHSTIDFATFAPRQAF